MRRRVSASGGDFRESITKSTPEVSRTGQALNCLLGQSTSDLGNRLARAGHRQYSIASTAHLLVVRRGVRQKAIMSWLAPSNATTAATRGLGRMIRALFLLSFPDHHSVDATRTTCCRSAIGLLGLHRNRTRHHLFLRFSTLLFARPQTLGRARSHLVVSAAAVLLAKQT